MQPFLSPRPIQLSGPQAFYRASTYRMDVQRDFAHDGLLPPSYQFPLLPIDRKIIAVLKQIVLFPYQIFQWMVGCAILMSSTISKRTCKNFRLRVDLEGPWLYKRMTVKVEGKGIDVWIVGTEKTLANGRWMLFSNGNYELMERNGGWRRGVLEATAFNGLYYNYPYVGESEGTANQTTLTGVQDALMTLVEHPQGFGARQFVCIGNSLGGGVLGSALERHTFNPAIPSLMVKIQTFSSLEAVARALLRPLGWVIRVADWNLNSLNSSRRASFPEVVIQTARTPNPQVEDLMDDRVISPEASLAHAFLRNASSYPGKRIFGVENLHGQMSGNLCQRLNQAILEQMPLPGALLDGG